MTNWDFYSYFANTVCDNANAVLNTKKLDMMNTHQHGISALGRSSSILKLHQFIHTTMNNAKRKNGY